MRILKLAAAFAMTTGLVACSGDDGGISTVDAARIDAGMDALNLTGLGQLCNDNSPCPQNAPICLTFSDTATNGYCTPLCQDDWTRDVQRGHAAGRSRARCCSCLRAPRRRASTPSAGTPGTPACGLAVDIRPAPPIQPNMMYTIDYTCADQSVVPATPARMGLVANTSLISECRVFVPLHDVNTRLAVSVRSQSHRVSVPNEDVARETFDGGWAQDW
jgi:hypothetical protein